MLLLIKKTKFSSLSVQIKRMLAFSKANIKKKPKQTKNQVILEQVYVRINNIVYIFQPKVYLKHANK